MHVSFKEIQNEEAPELGRTVEVREGDSVELTLTVDPAPTDNLRVRYIIETFGPFPATREDYFDHGNDVVTVQAGQTSTVIRLSIVDDGEIEPTRESFRVRLQEDVGLSYDLIPPERSTVRVAIKEGVCDRTPQVRDGIVGAISGVSDCADVTDAHLSGITGVLDLSNQNVAALRAGDFSGLGNLQALYLGMNPLTTLPANVFSGLDGLEALAFEENTDLRTLDPNAFSGLVNLRELDLYQLGGTSGEEVTLPPNLFSDLSALEWLLLDDANLAPLPEGIFEGLANLKQLRLPPDARLSFRFERVDGSDDQGSAQLRLISVQGAPYEMTVRLATANADLSTNSVAITSVTIPAGTTASMAFDVRRINQIHDAFVRISGVPLLPPRPDCGNETILLPSIEDSGCRLGWRILFDDENFPEFRLMGEDPMPSGVSIISSPLDGNAYVAGEVIRVEVTFNSAIRVDALGFAEPTLKLDIGGQERTADYEGTKSTDTMVLPFEYTVTNQDYDLDGISIDGDALEDPSGRALKPLTSVNLILDLGEHAVTDESSHKVIGRRLSLSLSLEPASVMAGSFSTATLMLLGDDMGRTTPVRVSLTLGQGLNAPPTVILEVGEASTQFRVSADLDATLGNSNLMASVTQENQESLRALVSGTTSEVRIDQREIRVFFEPSAETLVRVGEARTVVLKAEPELQGTEKLVVDLGGFESSPGGFMVDPVRVTLTPTVNAVDVTVVAGLTAVLGDMEVTVTLDPGESAFGNVAVTTDSLMIEVSSAEVSLEPVKLTVAEGTTAMVVVSLSQELSTEVTVVYRIEGHENGYDPAEPADYSITSPDVVTVEAGERTAALEIFINDDEEIEPTREAFRVVLEAPPGAFYTLASPVRTTAIVVINEGVCDRTERVGNAIVRAVGVAGCADVDDDDLSGVSSLSVETFGIESLQDRDLAGLVGLRNLDFSVGSRFADLQDLSGSVFSDLGSLESLDFGRNSLGGGDLPSTVFQSLVNLRSLDLSDNKLTSLPPGIFAGLVNLTSLDLSDNRFDRSTSLPPGTFTGLVNLRRLNLSDNIDLTSLPPGIFAGLDSLSTLTLRRTPVRFRLGFEEVSNPSPNDGVRAYRLSVDLGAPYQFTLGLAAEGGSVSTESVTIAVGSTYSGTFTATQAGNAPLTLTHGDEDAIEDAANGVLFAAAPELKLDERAPEVTSLLFYSSPDADGIYQEASDVKIAVLFDEAVRVTNMGDGLHLQLHSRGTSFAIGYDAEATGAAHDADSADADNHELVFSSAPFGVPASASGPESGFSIEQDMLLIHNAPQPTTITDVAGNPGSASLNGLDISTRAYRLRFDPAALRTVAGSDEDEQTLRTLHLEALPGSIRLPASDEVTVAFDPAPGDLAGVSVHAPDDDALLDDGTGQPGLTFTRTSTSRSVRVRVDGAANRVEGGGTAGGVTSVEASLSGHSRSSRGDEGLRVVPVSLLVGVVPLEVAPTPDLQRFRLSFVDAPPLVLNAGQRRNLELRVDPSLPNPAWRWRMRVSYEGQDGVTASYSSGPIVNFLRDVRLTAPQDAQGEIGILTVSPELLDGSRGFAPVAGAEVTPAVIDVRVRPFQEFPVARKYALAFTPDPLGVLVGEAKTVTLTLLDPDDTLENSDLVTVTLGLHGGSGTVVPETLTLSASDPDEDVTVTVDVADAFAGIDRSLWLTAEAAPVEGLQVGAAQLAVTASQPTFELTFDPSRPLTVPRGGATRTVSLRLSEAEGVALPPVGTRLSVPVLLSLGGDGVHLTPSQAVLTAEVDAQGVTAQAVEVEVRAESTAPQQSLVLVAEPDQAERSVRLISAALPVNVTPPVRQFGFEFEGTGAHALGSGNPGYFLVPRIADGTGAFIGVSPDRRLFVEGVNGSGQPGNPGSAALLASGLFRLTGDELAEGERVTATLTWYISEAGSPGDLVALGSALFRPGFFNADRDLVPPGTTWMYMWSGEKLLTDIYSTQAEVVFTGPGRPSIPLDFGRLPVGGPSPLALRISVSDDQERALNAKFTDGSLGVAADFGGRTRKGGRDIVLTFSESERCLQPGESAQVELRLYSGSSSGGNSDISGCSITPRLFWGEDNGTSVISVTPPRPSLRPNSVSFNGWILRARQSLTITAAATARPGESLVLRALTPEFPVTGDNDECPSVYHYTGSGGGAMSVCIAPREFDLNFTPPQALVQRGTTLPATVSLGRASLTGDESVTVALRVQGEANAGVVVSPSEVTLSRTETSAEFNVIVDAATATSSLAVVATVSGDQESALKANFNAGVLSLSLTDEVPPRRFDLRLTLSGEEDAAALRWDRETMVELSLVAENPLTPLTAGEEVEVTVSLEGTGLKVGAPGVPPASSIGVFLFGSQLSAPLSLSVARDEADRDDPARSRLLLASVSASYQEGLNALFTPANLEVEVVPYGLEDEPTREFALEFTQTNESDAPPIERLSLLANGGGTVYLRLKHVDGTRLTRNENSGVGVGLTRSFGEGLSLRRDSVDFNFNTGFSPPIDIDVRTNAPRQRAVLPASVPHGTARRLGASFDSAFLLVEVSPLEPVTEVLQERSYTLRFDPPEVQVTAGRDDPAEADLLLEGAPLTVGESAALRLVPSDPVLRVSPLNLSLGHLASSTTAAISPRDARNERRTEMLDVEPQLSQIPGATFEVQPLQIDVVRDVELTLTPVGADVDVLRIEAGMTTEVTVGTSPTLVSGESVEVAVSLRDGNALSIDQDRLTLTGAAPTAAVVVTALQALQHDELRTAAESVQGVSVFAAESLPLRTLLTRNVSLVFEPNPSVGEQGRSTEFIVTTFPRLGGTGELPEDDQSVTVTLSVAVPGWTFGTGSSTEVDVALNWAETSRRVAFRVAPEVEIGASATVRAVAAGARNVELIEPLPSLRLEASTPRVSVALNPGTELVLAVGAAERGMVTVSIPSGPPGPLGLEAPQRAAVRVEAFGAGLSIESDGGGFSNVIDDTLEAPDFSRTITVDASQEDVFGTLRVTVLSGADFAPVELPLRVQRSFTLRFDPRSIIVPAGGSTEAATIHLDNHQALADDETVTVVFTVSEDVNSILPEAPARVILRKSEPSAEFIVSAAWHPDPAGNDVAFIVASVDEALRNARVADTAPPLRVRRVRPLGTLSLLPAADPGRDVLVLTEGEMAMVTASFSPPLQGEQVATLELSLTSPDSPVPVGLLSSQEVRLGSTTPTAAFNVQARDDAAGRTARLDLFSTSGVDASPVNLAVQVRHGLRLSFDPAVETIPVGSSTPVTLRLRNADGTSVDASDFPSDYEVSVPLAASSGLRLALASDPGASPSSGLTAVLSPSSPDAEIIVTAPAEHAAARRGDESVSAGAPPTDDYALFEGDALFVSAPLPAELVFEPAGRLLIAPGGSTQVTLSLRGNPLRGEREARLVLGVPAPGSGFLRIDSASVVVLSEANPEATVTIRQPGDLEGAGELGKLTVSSTRIDIAGGRISSLPLDPIIETQVDLPVQVLQRVMVRFMDGSPPRIVAGAPATPVVVELVGASPGARLTGDEVVEVTLSGSDAVAPPGRRGEGVTFVPDRFTLTAASTSQVVRIRAGPRMRGPVRNGLRQLTATSADVEMLGTRPAASLSMRLVPEFHIGFSETALTLLRGSATRGSRTVRFELDVSIPWTSDREHLYMSRGLSWNGGRAPQGVTAVTSRGPHAGLLLEGQQVDFFEGQPHLLEFVIAADGSASPGDYVVMPVSVTLLIRPGYAEVPGHEFGASTSVSSLGVTIIAAPIFLAVLEPSPLIEVEQGRSATFLVTTDPTLEAGESATLSLSLSPPTLGTSFGGSDRLEVLLSATSQSGEVEISAPVSATIGSVIAGAVSLEVDSPDPNAEVSPDQPVFSVSVSSPRVAVSFASHDGGALGDELVLSENASTALMVSLAMDELTPPQQADLMLVFEAIGGPDVSPSVSRQSVTLSPASPSMQLDLSAGDYGGEGGSFVLRVVAVGGVALRAPVELPVRVKRRVELGFTPDSLTLIHGGPSEPARLEVSPPLLSGEAIGFSLGLSGYTFVPSDPRLDFDASSATVAISAAVAPTSATLDLEGAATTFSGFADIAGVDFVYGDLSLTALRGVRMVLEVQASTMLIAGSSLAVTLRTEPALEAAERTTATLSFSPGLTPTPAPGEALTLDGANVVLSAADSDFTLILNVAGVRSPGERLTLEVSGMGEGVGVLEGASLTLEVVKPQVSLSLVPETARQVKLVKLLAAPDETTTAVLSIVPGTLGDALMHGREALVDVEIDADIPGGLELASPSPTTLTTADLSRNVVLRALTPAVSGTLRVSASPDGDVEFAPVELPVQVLQRVVVRFMDGSPPRIVAGAAATPVVVELVGSPPDAELTGYEVVEVTLSGSDAVSPGGAGQAGQRVDEGVTFDSASSVSFTLTAASTRREVRIGAGPRTRGPERNGLRQLTTVSAEVVEMLGTRPASSLSLRLVPEFHTGFSETALTLVRGSATRGSRTVRFGLYGLSIPVASYGERVNVAGGLSWNDGGTPSGVTVLHEDTALDEQTVEFSEGEPRVDVVIAADESASPGDYVVVPVNVMLMLGHDYAEISGHEFGASTSTSSLEVTIIAAPIFSAVLEPAPPIEVEQGRSTTFLVAVDPTLQAGESATVSLSLSSPTLVSFGGRESVDVLLSATSQSSEVEISASASVPIDSVIAGAVSLAVDSIDPNTEVSPDQPVFSVLVTSPRVALSLASHDGGALGDELVLSETRARS